MFRTGFLPIVILSFAPLALADCPTPQLPAHFQIDERVLSLTNTFDLTAGSTRLGSLRERILSLTRSFDFTSGGQRIATAEESFFSWGTEIKVYDCTNSRIATIKEQVFKSLFKVSTTYSILDARDQLIATSEKSDWLATSFVLRDTAGKTIATMSRPMFVLIGDTWKVELQNASALDPRVLVMIAAYKTSVDNSRRSE